MPPPAAAARRPARSVYLRPARFVRLRTAAMCRRATLFALAVLVAPALGANALADGHAGLRLGMARVYVLADNRVWVSEMLALERAARAAGRGNAAAQFNLGQMYRAGQGAPQDYAQAVKWYREAAEQGHADAQKNLGVMYDNGEGVPVDDAEAVRWYREAAEQGHAGAQNNLGGMYDNGEGVPVDELLSRGRPDGASTH